MLQPKTDADRAAARIIRRLQTRGFRARITRWAPIHIRVEWKPFSGPWKDQWRDAAYIDLFVPPGKPVNPVISMRARAPLTTRRIQEAVRLALDATRKSGLRRTGKRPSGTAFKRHRTEKNVGTGQYANKGRGRSVKTLLEEYPGMRRLLTYAAHKYAVPLRGARVFVYTSAGSTWSIENQGKSFQISGTRDSWISEGVVPGESTPTYFHSGDLPRADTYAWGERKRSYR